MLSVSVKVRDTKPLTTGLTSRLTLLKRSVDQAAVQAAAEATRVSRAKVRTLRPPAPTQRHNRYAGLRGAIEWVPNGTGVALNVAELNAKFPPWLVQEIGTGERAVQRAGGSPNAPGRPAKGATYIKTVRSQKGRKISSSLVFATRGGKFTPPGAAAGQQLWLRKQVKGAPAYFDHASRRSPARIVIEKEIEAQHFVQKGAQEGFREYRTSVLAAARSQLKKKP